MALRSTWLVAVLVVLPHASPAAQGRIPAIRRPPPGVTAALRKPPPGARVVGSVWSSADKGIGEATVRLRNVKTGSIDAIIRADSAGQFSFQGVNAGNYVIEIVNANGSVAALGQVFSVAPGETVAAFVRLGPRIPFLNAFVGNAAASSVSSAASMGVTAITPAGQNISPGQ